MRPVGKVPSLHLIFMLLPGTFLGVWNLLAISEQQPGVWVGASQVDYSMQGARHRLRDEEETRRELLHERSSFRPSAG
jgi:hypothetical protein